MFQVKPPFSGGRCKLTSKSKFVVSICLVLASLAWTCIGYSPEVNHRAIAGVWKLRQRPMINRRYPLKEFTVYPKDKNRPKPDEQGDDILLMLKEDGSFQQYSDEENKVPDKLKFCKADDGVLNRYFQFGRLKGKWSLVDGKLVLAADRSVDGPSSKIEDTLLEGKVVARSADGLVDNPALRDGQNGNRNTAGDSGSILDTHLSVPSGQVQVGRFTYPQNHPSFFESPMFKPIPKGNFELKQILGSLNTRQGKDQEEESEKFLPSVFYDKKFLLTSHPLPDHKPKGKTRWSIKHNRFVEDPPYRKNGRSANMEDMDQPVHRIRVLEVQFFSNNTFATIGGMGGSTILRGKFSIVGREKDHLWMQIWRFGFGRSVSGSVFSEGSCLSKDDEKTYWGKIQYVDADEGGPINQSSESKELDPDSSTAMDRENVQRLMVKGSVIFGYGLEPQPVGLFVMTESVENVDFDNDDDEDDGGSDDDDDNHNNRAFMDSNNIFQ